MKGFVVNLPTDFIESLSDLEEERRLYDDNRKKNCRNRHARILNKRKRKLGFRRRR
jgi:hypothetical protein